MGENQIVEQHENRGESQTSQLWSRLIPKKVRDSKTLLTLDRHKTAADPTHKVRKILIYYRQREAQIDIPHSITGG